MVQLGNWVSVQLVMRSDIRSPGSIVVTQHKLLPLDAIRPRVKTIANSIDPCDWHSVTAGPLVLLSHLFLLSCRQQSHFHMKLSHHFCWQVTPAWVFFFFYTFLISPPKARIISAKWASRGKFKQLIKPDESINLHEMKGSLLDRQRSSCSALDWKR